MREIRIMRDVCALARIVSVTALFVALPASAFAQASIAGTVKDASGAVLPGVTVEASSPALIEKVRSAVTDGTGQYRVVDLRPGTFSVTFTLPGFATVRRDGIELTGSFTATVNAELRVGSVEETVTVTGEAPTVDLQSTTRQRVIDRETVDIVPSGRNQYNLAVLVPGVSLSARAVSGTSNQDVGGAVGNEQVLMVVHGSRGGDQRITQNGISLASASSGANVGALLNPTSFEEVTVDVSGASAELGQGGLRINVIPREGGNSFRGTFFGGYANDALQGSNFSDDLRRRGLISPNLLKRNFDVNPGFGGPISRDRLWFYTSVRYNVADNFAAGMFANANANNPDAWTYVADTSRPASNDGKWKDATGRLTWQVTPRNKFAVSYDQQHRCSCPFQVNAITSPEAGSNTRFPLQRSVQFDWTTPLTNRLLFEAVGIQRIEGWGFFPVDGLNSAMISVREQSTGLTYRSRASYSNSQNENVYYRAALSYITGSHALKVGFNDGQGGDTRTTTTSVPLNYQFNNGVPNQIALWATPFSARTRLDHDLGIYAQDKWTIGRLALNLGVRYDHFASSFPEQHVGPSVFTPSRDLTFEERSNLSWHDVTPKLGASIDLFGNGRTAFKTTLNKYVEGQALGELAASPNPVNALVNSTTRSWVDVDRDFVVDCDLANPAAQNGADTCGALANANFGRTIPGATFDPDILTGWGRRGSNWEFSAGVQHEVMPRVSVDVAYFRRWYNHFLATDDRSVSATDYDTFSITVPTHASLPDGGGYTLAGLKALKPASFGRRASNFVTFADDYGKQTEHWNGVDVTVNARLESGLLLQGGLSTGRTSTNNCEVVAQLPEMLFSASTLTLANPGAWLPEQFCAQQSPFLTQVKLLGSYEIPVIDVRVSATLQSVPGPLLVANYVVPGTVAAQALGRPLAGGAANLTANILEPGAGYGERFNQLDLRFARVLRFGSRRASVGVDVYNTLNSDAVLAENQNFAVWRRPTQILPARFAKFSVQVDF